MLLEISIKTLPLLRRFPSILKGDDCFDRGNRCRKVYHYRRYESHVGARATTDVIRHGAPKAEIEGLFSVENSRLFTGTFLMSKVLELGDEIHHPA